MIVEQLSPKTEREDRTTKFRIYEKTLKTPEYFLYDPDTQRLEGFRLKRGRYKPIVGNEQGWLWSEQMELYLGTWSGVWAFTHELYLCFYTADGTLVPTGDEAGQLMAEKAQRRAARAKKQADKAEVDAKKEKQRADEAAKRADDEKQRADAAETELNRLREMLRQASNRKNGSGH